MAVLLDRTRQTRHLQGYLPARVIFLHFKRKGQVQSQKKKSRHTSQQNLNSKPDPTLINITPLTPQTPLHPIPPCTQNKHVHRILQNKTEEEVQNQAAITWWL